MALKAPKNPLRAQRIPLFHDPGMLKCFSSIPCQVVDPASGSLDKVNFMWGMTPEGVCPGMSSSHSIFCQRKHSWLGELLCPSLRSSQGWRHPGEHKPSTADSPGHVSHSTQLSQCRETFLEASYQGITVSPAWNPSLALYPSYSWSSSAHLFTLAWFSPPREKNFFCFHLSESFSRGAAAPLKLF